MAAAKKPMKPVAKPMKPPVKPVKPPVKPVKPVANFYNQAGKPDPAGLFDRDGFQVRFDKDVKRDKFTKQPKGRTKQEIEAARRSGYNS